MDEPIRNEGWGFPVNSKKAHYFRGTMSLCARWMFFGALEENQEGSSPDDCQTCAKKLNSAPAPKGKKGEG